HPPLAIGVRRPGNKLLLARGRRGAAITIAACPGLCHERGVGGREELLSLGSIVSDTAQAVDKRPKGGDTDPGYGCERSSASGIGERTPGTRLSLHNRHPCQPSSRERSCGLRGLSARTRVRLE